MQWPPTPPIGMFAPNFVELARALFWLNRPNDFEAHTFVIDVEHRAIARLDRAYFDFELLTTDTDALRVALDAKRAIASRIAESEAFPPAIAAVRKSGTIRKVVVPWPRPARRDIKVPPKPRTPPLPIPSDNESGALPAPASRSVPT